MPKNEATATLAKSNTLECKFVKEAKELKKRASYVGARQKASNSEHVVKHPEYLNVDYTNPALKSRALSETIMVSCLSADIYKPTTAVFITLQRSQQLSEDDENQKGKLKSTRSLQQQEIPHSKAQFVLNFTILLTMIHGKYHIK